MRTFQSRKVAAQGLDAGCLRKRPLDERTGRRANQRVTITPPGHLASVRAGRTSKVAVRTNRALESVLAPRLSGGKIDACVGRPKSIAVMLKRHDRSRCCANTLTFR